MKVRLKVNRTVPATTQGRGCWRIRQASGAGVGKHEPTPVAAPISGVFHHRLACPDRDSASYGEHGREHAPSVLTIAGSAHTTYSQHAPTILFSTRSFRSCARCMHPARH